MKKIILTTYISLLLCGSAFGATNVTLVSANGQNKANVDGIGSLHITIDSGGPTGYAIESGNLLQIKTDLDDIYALAGTQTPIVITPSALSADAHLSSHSTVYEAARIAKTSSGNLYGIDVSATTTGEFLLLDSTTNTSGSVNSVKCFPYPTANVPLNVSYRPGPTPYLTTGIVVAFSSSTNCFTNTPSSTAHISVDYQ